MIIKRGLLLCTRVVTRSIHQSAGLPGGGNGRPIIFGFWWRWAKVARSTQRSGTSFSSKIIRRTDIPKLCSSIEIDHSFREISSDRLLLDFYFRTRYIFLIFTVDYSYCHSWCLYLIESRSFLDKTICFLRKMSH